MNQFTLDYLRVLRGTLKGLNLTTLRGDREFYVKNYLDSILPWQQGNLFSSLIKRIPLVIDVGFGGGFPLLPLASVAHEVKFLGIESRKKKVLATNTIIKSLKIPNVCVYHQKLEDLVIDLKCVLTFRAVGRCGEYLNKINASKEVYAFFYKGPNFFQLEGSELEKIPSHWEIMEKKFYALEGTQGRWFIGFKNKFPSPHGPKKEVKLRKLSDFNGF